MLGRIFFSYFYFFIMIFFYFTILYWFCHTSTCIRHGFTHVPHPEPPYINPHVFNMRSDEDLM